MFELQQKTGNLLSSSVSSNSEKVKIFCYYNSMAVNKNSTNPWRQIIQPSKESLDLDSIIRNQKQEKQIQEMLEKENRKHYFVDNLNCGGDPIDVPTQDNDELKNLESEMASMAVNDSCDCDEVIAEMLQAQFDREYNEELKRIEKAKNKQSKVTVCLDKYKRTYLMDVGEDIAENSIASVKQKMVNENKNWDRFETNQRLFETVRKCGYMLDEDGDMITKHDANVCGIRNVSRMMSFPLDMATGDGAGFDMKLSNRVFNELKTYSNKARKKNSHMQDRKDNIHTAEMGMDGRTRLLLYKLINNQVLDDIHGIISTGKEAIILYANMDENYISPYNNELQKSKECAIKIFKTTLNDFKQRDRYIKDDYRFKDRFKSNQILLINMWAEKEMHNLHRMQKVHIKCPKVILLKKHILLISFIGENGQAAPKLKDAILTNNQWIAAYEQVKSTMHKLYNDAKLIHADLSEYNILWYQEACWFIDVAQSVEPQHPGASEFLMRDCNNITEFFTKKDIPMILTKEELFKYITGLDAETYNATMLECIHTKAENMNMASSPKQKQRSMNGNGIKECPFNVAWEKSQQERYDTINHPNHSVADTI